MISGSALDAMALFKPAEIGFRLLGLGEGDAAVEGKVFDERFKIDPAWRQPQQFQHIVGP